jgi:ATP-binding cassette, subfamily C (CFTR/MRP), member 1
LFKLIQVDQGSVLIDGIDLANVAPDRVRDAIVGLPQDFLTLDGSTVRYNIDPLGVKTDEQIKQILEMTQLWTHLEPRGGLDLTVTEDVLSHGELQLLAFARVMARESKILVLDEISSSMDETTGAVVDELTRTKFHGWTIISVAHKLESIRHFDKILVLDAGRIAEFGEPDALLADPSSLFKKLYEGKIE